MQEDIPHASAHVWEVVEKEFCMGKNFVGCKKTAEGIFIPCPICGHGRLMKITPETCGKDLVLWCKRCKKELAFDVEIGRGENRVTFRWL